MYIHRLRRQVRSSWSGFLFWYSSKRVCVYWSEAMSVFLFFSLRYFLIVFVIADAIYSPLSCVYNTIGIWEFFVLSKSIRAYNYRISITLKITIRGETMREEYTRLACARGDGGGGKIQFLKSSLNVQRVSKRDQTLPVIIYDYYTNGHFNKTLVRIKRTCTCCVHW